MNIKEAFDSIAKRYDEQRRKLIPYFDAFYGVVVTLPSSDLKNPKILDLGAGTGLLSQMLLDKYPDAEITLVDLSDEMLKVARQRFANNKNVTIVVADYLTKQFDTSFDIIVSTLSIHHLDDSNKEALYKRAFSMLNKGGVFINGDQFLATHSIIEASFHEHWKAKMEATDLSKEEIESAYERMKFDRPSTIAQSLTWLESAGFARVELFYKYFNFGVIAGWK